MPLQFVKTEEGDSIKVNDKGLPLVIDDSKGDEAEPFAIDPINLYTQVPALRNEAASYRKERDAASAKIKSLVDAGIELSDDPDTLQGIISEITDAVSTVKNLKDGDLVKAGEVDTIKKQAQEGLQKQLDTQKKSFDGKIGELEGKLARRDSTIKQLLIDNQFVSSEFVNNQLWVDSNMALKLFGDCFKIEMGEDGKHRVFGYYPDSGERVYSRERPGEPADFDEALSLLVEKSPSRDKLFKGSGASGSGAAGSAGEAGGGFSENPFSEEHFNLTEQSRLMAEDPDKAMRMARAAGVDLYSET